MRCWWLLALLIACSTPPRHDSPVPPRQDDPLGTCRLEGKWVDQPRELRMSPASTPYATIYDVAQASVRFEAHGVSAILRAPSLELEGFIDARRLQLHARRPFVVGGFLVPGPAFPLGFVASRGDTLVFEAVPQNITTKLPVRAEVRCGELAIDARPFDPRTAIVDKPQRTTSLASERDIPLSLEATSPPIAELRYDNSPLVDVLETRGTQVRVAVLADTINPNHNIVVFGWVPGWAVLDIAQGMGGSWARGVDGAGTPTRPSKRPRVTCTEPVPLSVQHDRDVRRVGRIAANTVIVLVDDNDPVEVSLPRARAELAEGARWLVARAALARCSTTPP